MSVFLLVVAYAGIFWPLTALLVLVVVVAGFVVRSSWLRVVCFGLALLSALVGVLGAWVVAHLTFGF